MKLATLICGLIVGCTTIPNLPERVSTANQIAQNKGWQSSLITTSTFNLQAYTKPLNSLIGADQLTIYIEGDGHAWNNRETPSEDPTPIDPITLRLATQDPSKAVAYIGRPCQYGKASNVKDSTACSEPYWTNKRFSPEVIKSTNEAINQLKDRYHAKKLILVGYSGGATVALLSTVSRKDVVNVVSIAGNLDTTAWVKYHAISPLTGSLNPANFTTELTPIPQILYIGGKDQIIPWEVTKSYVDRFPVGHQPKVIVMKDYGHLCCWAEGWEALQEK